MLSTTDIKTTDMRSSAGWSNVASGCTCHKVCFLDTILKWFKTKKGRFYIIFTEMTSVSDYMYFNIQFGIHDNRKFDLSWNILNTMTKIHHNRILFLYSWNHFLVSVLCINWIRLDFHQALLCLPVSPHMIYLWAEKCT